MQRSLLLEILQKYDYIECRLIFLKFLEIIEPYLNLNALYEFECEKTVVTSFKEDDFVLSKFDLKLELADRTVSDDVKRFSDSSDTILIKPDKISAPSDIKEKLLGQGEKFRKISTEIQLKSLTIAYENFLPI